MQDHGLMASAGGCTTPGNDSGAPQSHRGTHCVTLPRGTGAPITRGDNNRPPLPPGTVTNKSPFSKTPVDPSPSSPSGAGRGVPPAAAASGCGTLRARCHSLGEASWKIILLPATRGLAATQPSAHRAISIGLPSGTAFALLPVTKTRVSSSALRCAFTAGRGHTPGSAAVPAAPTDSGARCHSDLCKGQSNNPT